MEDDSTETVTVPASLHADLERVASDREERVADLVADALTRRVAVADAVATYTGREREDSPSAATLDAATLAESPPPIGALLGFELDALEPGRAAMRFDAGPEHANPMGTLHGGVICDVGDAAMGTAFASTLDADESFTTLELDVKFRRPVWDGELVATAEVTDRGRTTGLVECTVENADGEIVAKLDSVCLVLRGDAASGR